MGCLLHGEGTNIYFSHSLRYHEMLEDVLSIWAVPAGSLAQLLTGNWTSTYTHVTSRLCGLFYVPQIPPSTITQLISTLLVMLYDEIGCLRSGLNTAYFERLLIFLKFLTDSSSPTLYLSESVKILFIWLELMNLCYMRNGVPGPKIPCFKNHKYFS